MKRPVVLPMISIQFPNAFQLIGMNIATISGTAGWTHFNEFLTAKIAAIKPAIPNEIIIAINAQVKRPIAPLWSPKSRLSLSLSTHSNNSTAKIRNTSMPQTGTIHDISSL